MSPNIQIDFIILQTDDEQFTLTTKKIIAYHLQVKNDHYNNVCGYECSVDLQRDQESCPWLRMLDQRAQDQWTTSPGHTLAANSKTNHQTCSPTKHTQPVVSTITQMAQTATNGIDTCKTDICTMCQTSCPKFSSRKNICYFLFCFTFHLKFVTSE